MPIIFHLTNGKKPNFLEKLKFLFRFSRKLALNLWFNNLDLPVALHLA
jgi:hypothetical protein